MKRPTLRTTRLTLRPFEQDDAPAVTRLAGDREIALNTATIPHPYPEGEAERWISRHQEGFDAGSEVTFAVFYGDELVGAVGLAINRDDDNAEIGYWIGVPYWGRGYASEASEAVLHYGFEELALNKIYARFFTRNPASGRVMQKLGMELEGRFRRHHKKWGEYLDTEQYGLLREEWMRRRIEL
ncbi:MAG TPA: GNAT family N-acetyltransferase [Thermoanaerobaculia bacterium]|jgi:RimJ/RimL family protein N-acetyltransferase